MRPEAIAEFRNRLIAYGEKAMREGKRRSSWVNVDEVYEGAVRKLFTALIAPGSDFLSALRPFARRLAHLGMLASLGRTVLKCTLPGLPDTYQGTEIWDFSFVDPDNRRPVDYPALERMLEAGRRARRACWATGRTGGSSRRRSTRLLAERAERPDFYASAAYEPVDATGPAGRPRRSPTGGPIPVRRVATCSSRCRGSSQVWSARRAGRAKPSRAPGSRSGQGAAGATSCRGASSRAAEGADLGDLLRDLPYAVLRRES
ncbi:hypothetical protein ACU4GR_04770 [Methylobacterium oryzae CBMB20]